MAGLTVPDKKYAGRFRGEADLETARVWVGPHEGTAPERVASELQAFERVLQRAVAALDARYPRGEALDTDGLSCSWRTVNHRFQRPEDAIVIGDLNAHGARALVRRFG